MWSCCAEGMASNSLDSVIDGRLDYKSVWFPVMGRNTYFRAGDAIQCSRKVGNSGSVGA